MFSDHPFCRLDSEALARELEQVLPLTRVEGEERKLKEEISRRVRKRKVKGSDIIAVLTAAGVPGADAVQDQPLFRQIFGGLELYFEMAVTAQRGAQGTADTFLKTIFLQRCSAAVDGISRKIFSDDLIPERCRLKEFDNFYSTDQLWCIECGAAQNMTYNSAVCRPGEGVKAVHGCYISPFGWLRIALNTDPVPEEVWRTWHKAFHGTAGRNVKSIIDSGLVKPLEPIHGDAGAEDAEGGAIYCSPSIEYAAHHVYTDESELQTPGIEGVRQAGFECEGKFAQFVFEVRVRPGSYRVQGNTLCRELWPDWYLEHDIFCDSRNLEWIVSDKEDIVCTGVMLRQLSMDPEVYNERRIKMMKAHVQWDDTLRRPQRPREHGGVWPGERAAWEFNGTHADGDTLAVDESVRWIRYSPDICMIIERAYQDYQRFVFIGKPSGADGPAYYVDLMGMCMPDIGWPVQRRADADMAQDWRVRSIRRVPWR